MDVDINRQTPLGFTNGAINVKGDGYCGFRVLTKMVEGDEEKFPFAKAKMLLQVSFYHLDLRPTKSWRRARSASSG